MVNIENLESDLLHLLDVLPVNDCDLQSLVIGLNPNFIRSADQDLRPYVEKILMNLIKSGVIFSGFMVDNRIDTNHLSSKTNKKRLVYSKKHNI